MCKESINQSDVFKAFQWSGRIGLHTKLHTWVTKVMDGCRKIIHPQSRIKVVFTNQYRPYKAWMGIGEYGKESFFSCFPCDKGFPMMATGTRTATGTGFTSPQYLQVRQVEYIKMSTCFGQRHRHLPSEMTELEVHRTLR